MLQRQARSIEYLTIPLWGRLRTRVVCRLFFTLGVFCTCLAQEPRIGTSPAVPASPEERQRLTFAQDRLAQILVSIQQKNKELAELQSRSSAALDEVAMDKRRRVIQALEKDSQALQRSFEEIATGGVDLDYFQRGEKSRFDWRADLEEILQPLFDGLKDLTEKPRIIEKLRGERGDLRSRLQIIDNALTNIAAIEALSLKPDLADHVAGVADEWRRHREEAERDLDIVEFQLNQFLNQGDSFFKSIGQGLNRFFTGRGLNLLLAILVFLLSWSIMGMGLRMILKQPKDEPEKERGIYFRLFTYSYRVLTVLVSLFLVVMLLYALGDWILLGLLIIILIALTLGIKSFIPKFITETKLLLNIGSIRENERVLYNGLPWRVRSINVYSRLTNPELSGGNPRLSLAELAQLHSRPLADGEPWFPSSVGDYLLFPDGSWGKVLLQTPEIVRVQHEGGSITDIAATSLFESQAQNLSRGTFGVEVIFGIDYRHQSLSPLEAAGFFRNGVQRGLRQSPFGERVRDVVVEFQQAAVSSLDYRIFVTVNSAAAADYLAIRRAIRRLCVQVCNERGWIIPFTQLTLHQGEGFQALRGERPPPEKAGEGD